MVDHDRTAVEGCGRYAFSDAGCRDRKVAGVGAIKQEELLMAKKAKKEKAVFTKKSAPETQASAKEGIVLHAGASRNELMLAAKERGVKNFRVLNKQELTDILKNIGDQKAVDAIVAGAVARWKSGWGKKKVQNESQS